MAGFWAAIHVLRLALDLVHRASDWIRDERVRSRTIRELRGKSASLLRKARAARKRVRFRGSFDDDQPEQLRDNDGFRRD